MLAPVKVNIGKSVEKILKTMLPIHVFQYVQCCVAASVISDDWAKPVAMQL